MILLEGLEGRQKELCLIEGDDNAKDYSWGC